MVDNPGVTQRGKIGLYLTMNVANSKKKNVKLLAIMFSANTVISIDGLCVKMEIHLKVLLFISDALSNVDVTFTLRRDIFEALSANLHFYT